MQECHMGIMHTNAILVVLQLAVFVYMYIVRSEQGNPVFGAIIIVHVGIKAINYKVGMAVIKTNKKQG